MYTFIGGILALLITFQLYQLYKTGAALRKVREERKAIADQLDVVKETQQLKQDQSILKDEEEKL